MPALLRTLSRTPGRAKLAGVVAVALVCAAAQGGLRRAPGPASPPPSPPASAAVCAVIKDDAAYVTEWVEYHLWLGVDRLYVFDDGSPVALEQALRPFVDEGRVVMMPLPSNLNRTSYADSPQGYSYNACIRQACSGHDYMAFIDSDEFIMVDAGAGEGARAEGLAPRPFLRATHHRTSTGPTRLGTFLARGFNLSATTGILLDWVVLAGGHAHRPPGGILRNYVACLPPAHPKSHAAKSIANCAYLTASTNPHTFEYGRAPAHAHEVDEWGQPVSHDGTYTHTASHAHLYLHHYMFKSADDAAVKLRNGAGSGLKKSRQYYRGILHDANQTCGAAVGLADVCCPSTAV